MAVGTTATADLTRTELIDLALGRLGIGDPSNSDRSLGLQVLNMLIRSLDAEAKWFWAVDNTESTLTTVASQQTYATATPVTSTTISPNMLKLVYISVLVGTRRDPVVILDKPEALRTPLKDDTSSQPVAAYLQRAKLLTGNVLWLYPTPNAAYTIKYCFQRPLYDFTAASSNPDMPAQFNLALTTQLSEALAPYFNVPLPERQLTNMESVMQMQKVITGMGDSPDPTTLRTEYY